MMPVIRISDDTWGRLKQHARPLEDTADDVMNLALDALDKTKGLTPTPKSKPSTRVRANKGSKLPQKELRQPLLEVLFELDGSAQVKIIREVLEPRIQSKLQEADYSPVSTGEPRWWNATCWERNDLVKEGLFRNDSPRGVWELSEQGLRYLSSKRDNYSKS